MRLPATIAASAIAGGLLLGGCSAESDTPSAAASGSADAVSVVATTNIWADVAAQVLSCAGDGQASSLTPIGADPHDYSPSSQDIAAMVDADLVLANGLGLEEGLSASLDAARADGTPVVELAPMLDPMPFDAPTEDQDHDAADGDEQAEVGHSGDDPHVWLDPARVARAAALIGAELAEATGDEQLRSCGQSVETELAELDQQITATLSDVPPQRRILVTDHDALGYFAAAYDFTVAGTVVPGGSTLAEPSSAELADLAATVREAGVPAIFANTANPQALVDALAGEVGDVAVVDLFIGSLGPQGSGASTYQRLMTTNAQRISDALAG